MSKIKGFTLIELMVTVAILGILAAIGMPSMVDMMRREKAAEGTNRILSALKELKTEAMTRRREYIIIIRNKEINIVNNGSRKTVELPNELTYQVTPSRGFGFNKDGFLTPSSLNNVEININSTHSGIATRTISINRSGQIIKN
ncbi:pilus assembly FimT family protein [Zooshikella harenae]|uniref:Prepilin-type N-terminal cleavage/methylation domain-containing protein n=1 Tax=Zooshikella harenae TaxID=2827238 RepID=A0ABS5Z7X2_9GAMM|nr:prepilin-type N-terminal cleavage/methylation domain-containing protein [Zooshikella harenae]MBU2710149.1 prepilin-type N-terminal cleavage/methylation domain-containing protein [Zooshikella harenae]